MEKNPHAGEYAEIIKKMLAESRATARKLKAGALKERQKAAAVREEARLKLEEIKANTSKYAAEFEENRRRELFGQIRESIAAGLADLLLDKGESDGAVAGLTDLPEEFVKERRKKWFGAELWGDEYVWLTYKDLGRSGYVIFHKDKFVYDFPWEFGGGDALVVIEVPTEPHWEAATGLPLSERAEILEYMGRQVTDEKARGHRYEVKHDSIVIYR